MTPAYQSSCIFPFLLICFHVSSSCLGTRMCGTTVHLVPCLSLISSHLLSISLSPHLIWDDNQPRSRYHSYTGPNTRGCPIPQVGTKCLPRREPPPHSTQRHHRCDGRNCQMSGELTCH